MGLQPCVLLGLVCGVASGTAALCPAVALSVVWQVTVALGQGCQLRFTWNKMLQYKGM